MDRTVEQIQEKLIETQKKQIEVYKKLVDNRDRMIDLQKRKNILLTQQNESLYNMLLDIYFNTSTNEGKGKDN